MSLSLARVAMLFAVVIGLAPQTDDLGVMRAEPTLDIMIDVDVVHAPVAE